MIARINSATGFLKKLFRICLFGEQLLKMYKEKTIFKNVAPFSLVDTKTA